MHNQETTPLPAADYGTRHVTPHPLDYVAQTAQFMNAAGQNIPDRPEIPSVDVMKLRLSLCLEELYELAQGMGLEGTFCSMLIDKSGAYAAMGLDCGEDVPYIDHSRQDDHMYEPIEVLDALGDMAVVHAGTVLACGLQDAFPDAMSEISRSNQSKFPANGEELAATIEKYNREGVPVKAEFASANKAFPMVVTRAADGKVLKNAFYSPANLAPILEKFTT